MNEIETKAVETYKKNLLYFEKYQKAVYAKLAAFDSALEQNLYQLKYDLVFKEDYFDVVELGTGNYLYSSSSDVYASSASDSIDLKKESNAFETFIHIDIKEEELVKFEQVDITENNLSGFAPLLHYINKNSPCSSDLKRIEKFIFFGTGLGTHIISIDKKINAKVYLIIEDDLELFKLSLFTTPYYELAVKSQLFFSVFDSKEEFTCPALEFLHTQFYYNHYIKYFHMLSHNEEKLKEFHLKVASQSHNLFFYNNILKQYLKPLEYIEENFNFLNILKTQFSSSVLSKPVLLLAAGPSLQKNIKWLKENHSKFIVVALSATLSILEKEEIPPDVVTHLDGFDTSVAHFTKLNSLDFLKNTLFLMSARTPTKIINQLTKKNIFLFENGTSYKKNFGNLSAPCVGSTSYLLLLALDIKELYLLGLDLALDSESGSSHSEGHEYAKKLDLGSAQEHKDVLMFKDSVITTRGNFKQSVYTTPEYKLSIDSVNASSTGFKKSDQFVYNLNDGAHFTNTIAQNTSNLKTETLPALNKSLLRREISQLFTNNSSNQATQDELQDLQSRFEHALKVKSLILTQQNEAFDSSDAFLDSLITLFSRLTSSSSTIEHDLALVYQEYFRFIYPFIFDFFNTQGLSHHQDHAERINQLLCAQLLRIASAYRQGLSFAQETKK